MHEYLMIRSDHREEYSSIKAFGLHFSDDWMLNEGMRVGKDYPKNMVTQVHRHSGDKIGDFIQNIHRCLFISEEVKSFFLSEGLNDSLVEYLPFKLKTKEGDILEDQFWVANLLENVPCLDFDKSEIIYYKVDNEIMDVQSVMLHTDKIPPNSVLFRIAEYPSYMVIRSDFYTKIQALGFEGLLLERQGVKLLGYNTYLPRDYKF